VAASLHLGTGGKMIVHWECAHCKSSIVSGQRWVREKIYEPAPNGREPNYNRYHSEPFAGQEESCWEKHQMQQELARIRSHAA